jgi:hypothetical protein
MNNKHNSELEQLRNQLQLALSRPTDGQLQQQLEAAQARVAELEAQVAAMEPMPAEGASCTEQELEAYRRAEKVERQANERARMVYDQANAVLAEATAQAESASAHIGAIADQVTEQLKEYQQSVQSTKETFQQAVATLYAIRPEPEEEE